MVTNLYLDTVIILLSGVWQDTVVCMRPLGSLSQRTIKTKTKKVFLWMRDSINQANVLRLYGLTELDDSIMFVSEYCAKGQLQDVLFNDKFNLDDNFKFSMSSDIATGVSFLHSNNIIHGNITTENCYIDARWNVKISDWEYLKVSQYQENDALKYKPACNEELDVEADSDMMARGQFWLAPELLHEVGIEATQASDVYSFAMVLVEIFTREDLYSEELEKKPPKQIVNEIKKLELRPGE